MIRDCNKLKHPPQTANVINMEIIGSLKVVSEEIQQTVGAIDNYKRKIENLNVPMVNGEPWYKLSFGKASVKEVNSTMKTFSDYVQDIFRMIAVSQNMQNKNDQNICKLVGLLAIAEANSYKQIYELTDSVNTLSTEDKESIHRLKDLEKSFLASIDESSTDNAKKEEQMSRLIEYVALFTDSKTKKIRSIILDLAQLNTKLGEYCNTQDNWISNANDTISKWKADVMNSVTEANKQLRQTTLEMIEEKISQLDVMFSDAKEHSAKVFDELYKHVSENIVLQNDKIVTSATTIACFIKDSKDVVDNQNKTIEVLAETINNQNNIIATLQKKTTYILYTMIMFVLVLFGCIMYFLP